MNTGTTIPPEHTGIAYFEVMADISAKRSTKCYLEIGINTGLHLQHVSTDLGICIDPAFNLSENIMKKKNKLHLYQVTSDAFFADQDSIDSLTGQIDFAFLDGMHLFEYLVRDFYNTESIAGRNSLIAMHDCLPLNTEMTHRDFSHSLQIGQNTRHPNFWTGDVWKIIPILKKYRPDLVLICVETPPTGIVFVTNLDPENNVLQDNYIEIIKEFSTLPNSTEELERMYQSISLVPAANIVNEFDHSLYFRS